MYKTNVLKKTKTITFTSTASFTREYLDESFEYVQEEDLTWKIIDWLNGGRSNPSAIGDFVINEEEYDTELLNRRFTENLQEYVQQKILQRLQLHQGEFAYPYENTEDVGIPYLDKLSSAELDLFIKDAIMSIIGVREISRFISRKELDESKYGAGKIGYFADFEVKTIADDLIAQRVSL